jgi:leucyl-tRNA synthetase
VHTVEPFQKLVNQGMILGASWRHWDDDVADAGGAGVRRYSFREVRAEGDGSVAIEDGRPVKARWTPPEKVRSADGRAWHAEFDALELEPVIEKMSKSRGNVVNPDAVVDEHGADAMRLYEMFLGPIDKEAPWTVEGILGVARFLQRAWKLVVDDDAPGEPARALPDGAGTLEQQRLTAATVHGVTEDLEAMRFNTAIAKLMVFVRDVGRDAPPPREAIETFVKLVAPFAPHAAEELWEKLGHGETIAYAPWPVADAALLVADTVTLAVQVNGKRRAEIEVPADADDVAVRAAALASDNVRRHLEGREPRKVIVVKGRLVNVVV